MSILVRDEADIIKENIFFHAAAGVDQFIVTDNGSVDGTRELLEDLKQTFDITILDEPSRIIDQDLWVTRMAHLVREANSADWIICNDADEFWLNHIGTLKEALACDLIQAQASCDDIGVIYCQRFNLIPSREAVERPDYRFSHNHYKVLRTHYEPNQCNPWNENNSNSLIRTIPGKIITRLEGLDSIDMGNHGAKHKLKRHESNNVSIAHFPVRDFQQFERKAINFGKGVSDNPRFGPNVARHLQFWYTQHLRGNLQEEYRKIILPERHLQRLIHDGVLNIDMSVRSDIDKAISYE